MSDGRIVYDVEINNDGVDSQVRSTNSTIEQAANTGSSAFGEIWTGALRAVGAKLVELGQTAISAAKDVAMESLSQVASFEQNVGGIETLFGNAYKSVQEYADGMGISLEEASATWEQYQNRQQEVLNNANNAYKTSGLSANQYMETVTSFAAALNSSLGESAWQSGAYAEQAVVDMADNANKMGTSMESIQNAYQGFAKGNMTMLDNLKLGYGGTKTEMERLLADAEKLEGYAEGSLSIDSFADIVDAIHIVQENLGITGTTAKEASATISGSVASMKAAWDNFLTGTMDGNEFADVALTAVDNVVNAFAELIPRLIEGFIQMAPTLYEKAVEVISGLVMSFQEHAPDFIQSGIDFITNLGEGLATAIPEFLAEFLPKVLEFTTQLRENAGKFIDAGIDFILNLAQGIADSIPTLLENIPTIISNIAGIINDNMPKLLLAGAKIIITLAKGVIDAIPTLIAEFPKICQAIWDVITAINWLALGSTIITTIGNGIKAVATSIPNMIKNIGQSAWNFFKNINWAQLGRSIIDLIKSTLQGNFNAIPNALKSIGTAAWNAIKNIDWLGVGKAIVDGIVNGLKSVGSNLVNGAKDMCETAFNTAKGWLGIGSPSKLFETEVGYNIVRGFVKGEIENLDMIDDASEQMAQRALGATVGVDYDLPDIDSASREMSANLSGSFTSNVQRVIEVPLNIDAREIARATAWDMGEQLAWEMR